MRTLIWTAAWLGTAFWSLVAWGAWAFFGLVASVVRTTGGGDVPGFPVEPLSVAWLVDWLYGLGGAVFLVVWLVLSASILGIAAIVTGLFFPKRPTLSQPQPPRFPPRAW